MNHRTSYAVAGFLGALSLAPHALAADPVDLSPKLRAEREWRFQYTLESEMEFDILDETHEMALSKEVVVRATVVKVDDTGADVELVHERIRLDVRGEAPGTYDSTKPDNDPDNVYARLLSPLIDAPLTLHVDSSGLITGVRGLDDVKPSGLMEAQLFKGLFGEDELIRMYQPLFGLRPDDPSARVGESWDVTREAATSLGIVETRLQLKLERTSRGLAHVKIGGGEQLEPQPGIATVTKRSDVTGEAIWDLGEGVLLELDTTSTTLFAPDPDQTGGIALSGKAVTTTQLERLDSAGR